MNQELVKVLENSNKRQKLDHNIDEIIDCMSNSNIEPKVQENPKSDLNPIISSFFGNKILFSNVIYGFPDMDKNYFYESVLSNPVLFRNYENYDDEFRNFTNIFHKYIRKDDITIRSAGTTLNIPYNNKIKDTQHINDIVEGKYRDDEVIEFKLGNKVDLFISKDFIKFDLGLQWQGGFILKKLASQ